MGGGSFHRLRCKEMQSKRSNAMIKLTASMVFVVDCANVSKVNSVDSKKNLLEIEPIFIDYCFVVFFFIFFNTISVQLYWEVCVCVCFEFNLIGPRVAPTYCPLYIIYWIIELSIEWVHQFTSQTVEMTWMCRLKQR